MPVFDAAATCLYAAPGSNPAGIAAHSHSLTVMHSDVQQAKLRCCEGGVSVRCTEAGPAPGQCQAPLLRGGRGLAYDIQQNAEVAQAVEVVQAIFLERTAGADVRACACVRVCVPARVCALAQRMQPSSTKRATPASAPAAPPWVRRADAPSTSSTGNPTSSPATVRATLERARTGM